MDPQKIKYFESNRVYAIDQLHERLKHIQIALRAIENAEVCIWFIPFCLSLNDSLFEGVQDSMTDLESNLYLEIEKLMTLDEE